ncbi:hypothetical protein BED46_019785 [Burkholderia contaminans]|uniref:Uncharacterized protein n=1 Tax=Burkholderia contaminans LMG 23361 TaxID=1334628 RepID=A0ABD4AZB7_9BURK|nr:hypothetical protein WR31_10620 [Burkholderia contaminans LMG 23361]MBA9831730.1 hypothetical protein [Burkholderia contaminans]MBA9842397.1 hypothetical protein [Burkholderia contaminans]MBA9864894.1 hypothetical protein [Burkholderia contaminans]MBA9908071.1 hypothetical protein [Burkholderia contaminans]
MPLDGHRQTATTRADTAPGECVPSDRAGPFAVAFESVHHAGRISRFLAKLSLTFVEMTQ